MAVSGTGQSEMPQSLATPAFLGLSQVAESDTKAALTTGMTTDGKIFIFTALRGIMAEKCISGYSEVGIAPGLGPGDRAFEPHYSDQKPSEINDFRGLFLFFVYCGAGGEDG